MSASVLPHLLSDTNFNLYTLDWQLKVNEPSPGDLLEHYHHINQYFSYQNQKIISVTFAKASIHHLLSTSGVQKVKAKFALYPISEKEKVFTIILVGTDARGVHTSAYYVGSPSTKHYPIPPNVDAVGYDSDDCVPNNLATVWIDNWRKIALENVEKKLFYTSYGNLEGYTYEMSDFMYSLYPTGNINDEGLNMFFALHDHHYPGCTDPKDIRYTFGMVLQGFTEKPDGEMVGVDPAGDNLYYDLSAPCPPTC